LTISHLVTTLLSPDDEAKTNSLANDFVCNISSSELQLSNVTLYIWNITSDLVYNVSQNISGETNETTLNYTFNEDGNYTWNCKAYDNASNSDISDSNYTLLINTAEPTINLILPDDDTSTDNTSIDFEFNVSDDNDIINCSLIIDGSIEETDTSITKDITQEITNSFSEGEYEWKIKCVDEYGNIKNSETRDLEITDDDGGGGGSSSSSPIVTSYWTSTKSPSEIELIRGYTEKLEEKDRVKVKVDNKNHYVGIIDLTSSKIKINVSSEPQQATLDEGEARRFEVTDDDYYDIYVKLNEIDDDEANMTIKKIYELVGSVEEVEEATDDSDTIGVTGDATNETTKEKMIITESKWFWIAINVVIIGGILGFIGYHIYKKRRYYFKGF
jgi:hypothetical protein